MFNSFWTYYRQDYFSNEVSDKYVSEKLKFIPKLKNNIHFNLLSCILYLFMVEYISIHYIISKPPCKADQNNF